MAGRRRPRDRRAGPLRSCARRGAAIDVIVDRGSGEPVPDRLHPRPGVARWCSGSRLGPANRPGRRSAARPPGRPVWRTRPSWRSSSTPTSATRTGSPTNRSGPSRGPCPPATTASCVDGRLVAAVERKSLADLVASLTSGRSCATPSASSPHCRAPPWSSRTATRRCSSRSGCGPRWSRTALAELAGALAHECRWSSPRPGALAEEWTYRYLAASAGWARDEHALGAPVPGIALAPATSRSAVTESSGEVAPGEGGSAAEVRAWARTQGLAVADRGRISAEIVQRYRAAHLPTGPP